MPVLPILERRLENNVVKLPARVILDQGSFDVCFSCALATAMEARSSSVPRLSPAYHYFYASGAFPQAGLSWEPAVRRAIEEHGIAAFASHRFAISPYRSCELDIDGITFTPLAPAVQDGSTRRLQQADSPGPNHVIVLRSTDPSKESFAAANLRSGAPVLVVFKRNQAYEALRNNDRFVLESASDGFGTVHHVACLIGLIEADRQFIVQDSRGTSFGRGGQWLLPYDLIEAPMFAELYAVYSAGN